MKRVLLVSEARGLGGAELYLERLAQGVPGWEAEIALPDRPCLDPWADRLTARQIPHWRYTDSIPGWLGFSSRVRRAAPDLIHINLPSTYDGRAGVLACRLGALVRRPVTVSEHLTGLPRSRRRAWIKQRTASCVAGIVVPHTANRDDLIAAGRDPSTLHIIPHGIPDPGPVQPVPDQSVLRLAVLATLEPRKQIDLLIRAVADASDTPLHLDIGGSGPEATRLRALVQELGQESRVQFAGPVADANAFLAAAHLMVLSSRLEGMPLVILDAFAAGRGVLVSDLPGLHSVVVDPVGRRLPPTQTVWAETLRDAFHHPQRVRDWGHAARARFEEHYTLEVSRARMGEFWNAMGSGFAG